MERVEQQAVEIHTLRNNILELKAKQYSEDNERIMLKLDDAITHRLEEIMGELTALQGMVEQIRLNMDRKRKPKDVVVVPELGGVISKQQAEQYEKPKRAYHKRKRSIEGKLISDAQAKQIMEEMKTDLTCQRYDKIIGYLKERQTVTKGDISTELGFSNWNTEAHLKYGVIVGDIETKKKQHELRRYWLSKKAKENLKILDPATQKVQGIAKELRQKEGL